MSSAIGPDRVAVYIRWSTEDQGEGTTLAVQQASCALFVRSQGWEVRTDLTFIDDGYSGGNLKRPALDALRRAVAGGQVDCVVVFKLDRLSRSVVDTVNLVLAEWEGRCHCKSAREPIDTATPAGKMFFYLLASYAEWERSVIRERTAGGRLQRAHQGYWAGGPAPFGYHIDAEKRLAAIPAQAAVVRGIFDSYRKGRTVGDIVRQLQHEGAPAPRGPGEWSRSLVHRVLSNPVYMGVLLYGRWRSNPRHGRDGSLPRLVKAPEPAVQLAGAVPAVIDGDTFRAVQQARASRDARRTRRSGAAYSSRWLLSGIARCAKCGSSLGARAARNGRLPHYYCLGRALKFNCDGRMIMVRDLDAWFVQELKRVYGDRVQQQQALANLEAGRQARLAQLQASLAAVEGALARLEKERTALRRRFRAGELGAGEYREFIAEIAAELQVQQGRRHRLKRALGRSQPGTAAESMAARLRAADAFASLPPRDQKHLVFRLVQALMVYRRPGSDAVDAAVTWRLPAGAPAPGAEKGQEAPAPDSAGLLDHG